MFDNIRIGVRLMVGIIAVVLLAVILTLVVVMNSLGTMADRAEQRELSDLAAQLVGRLDQESARATAMAETVAKIPDVQEAMGTGDRERLAEMVVPSFDSLSEHYGVGQYQFHTPPATSFLRVHSPDNYGDDLSDFRQTVVDTNDKRTAISGLEEGVAGLGIRGVVPIEHNGEHVGSVEFGLSFGDSFFEEFTDETDSPVALYLRDGRSFSRFGGTISGDSTFSDAEMREVMEGEELVRNVTYEGTPMAVVGAP